MTKTDTTAYERFELAVKAADEAEEVLVKKGAAATDEERATANDASRAMIKAAEDFQRETNGKAVEAILANGPDKRLDGKSFDELADAAGMVNPDGMTVGEAFVKSAAFEELVDRHLAADGKIQEGVKSRTVDFAVALTNLRNDLKFVEGDEVATKALVTGLSPTSAGALVGQPTRLPGVADQVPLRQNRLWDLCTRIPLTTDALEYVEITAKTNNAAPVAEATSAGGLASAGHPDAVTDAAGGVKPESAITMNTVVNLVESLAHWVPLTRRAAADAPQLQAVINAFLVGGLNVVSENQMMSGDGVSPNLRGLINATNPYSIQTFDISANGAPSRLDAVALAAALIMDAMEEVYEPTALLVHPLDWMSTDFALAKDSQGQYYGAGPFASIEALRQAWGYRVVLTKGTPQGTQVLGDFRQALIGDREQSAMYMTDSHSDFFVRNILTMLAETRLSFGVRIPQAFCTIVP